MDSRGACLVAIRNDGAGITCVPSCAPRALAHLFEKLRLQNGSNRFRRSESPGEEPPMSIRPVKSIVSSKPTLEGAGVHLRRAFGFGDTTEFDPFLLLQDFRNDRPEQYRAGFPWH